LGKHLDVEVMLGLGTESDTIKFQGITYSDVTLKLDSMYGFFLKPKFELGPNFEIFGRLGYVHAVATLDFTGDIPYTTTKSGVSYGAGVRMLIDPKVSFDIDYTSYLGKSDHKASGFTFGVGYTF
jgi:outer membrane autotransporter protein